MDVTLIIHSVDGAREVPLSGSRLTLGRTEPADLVINDQSLSRVHASINRDGDRVWIIDEGSTNGSLVNDAPVPASGTSLRDGDEIYLGNTTIVVSFSQSVSADLTPADAAHVAAPASRGLPMPVIASAASLAIILFAAIVIGLAIRSNNDHGQITVKKRSANIENDDPINTTSPSSSPSASESSTPGTTSTVGSDSPNVTSPTAPTKRYLAMSADEQTQFVQREAQHVARMIGNREGEAVTPQAVLRIKSFVDTYALRVRRPRLSVVCNAANWLRFDLTSVLERGKHNAPFIIRAFNEKGVEPQFGLYLAMIETEYCECLQSPTGPLGMFQFTQATGRKFGLNIIRGASPSNPDERCKPEAAARAAASFAKFLTARYGTGPLSVPLAIASYNSGEGDLSSNLSTALASAIQEERSFWTLVANQGKLTKQFQTENVKYVPKFFGAAIVGENPRVFGVDMEPISSYTQQQSNVAANQ